MITVGTHATKVYSDDEGLHVRYHNTRVVSAAGRTVTLRNGGWYTATTKKRMNQFAYQYGYRFWVYQKDFAWYVDTPEGELQFEDGMTFRA